MQVTLEARPEEIVGEEKNKMIGQTLQRQNDTFSSVEIWIRIFNLRTVVGG